VLVAVSIGIARGRLARGPSKNIATRYSFWFKSRYCFSLRLCLLRCGRSRPAPSPDPPRAFGFPTTGRRRAAPRAGRIGARARRGTARPRRGGQAARGECQTERNRTARPAWPSLPEYTLSLLLRSPRFGGAGTGLLLAPRHTKALRYKSFCTQTLTLRSHWLVHAENSGST
jgi:hypothetical protein